MEHIGIRNLRKNCDTQSDLLKKDINKLLPSYDNNLILTITKIDRTILLKHFMEEITCIERS